MDYTDFLKLPEVSDNFNSMYLRQKEYFLTIYSGEGFDKEYREIMSIKTAMINTDLYFSEIHRIEDKKQKKAG